MITPDSIDFSVLPSLCLSRRSELPETPAIYFAIDSLDQIQYIGRSRNLRQRWHSHHRQSELQAIDGIRIVWLHCEDISLLGEIEAAWAFTIKASDSDSRIRLIHGDGNYLLTAHSTDYSNQAIASILSDEELGAICLSELQSLGRADMVSRFLHDRHQICRTELKGNHDLNK